MALQNLKKLQQYSVITLHCWLKCNTVSFCFCCLEHKIGLSDLVKPYTGLTVKLLRTISRLVTCGLSSRSRIFSALSPQWWNKFHTEVKTAKSSFSLNRDAPIQHYLTKIQKKRKTLVRQLFNTLLAVYLVTFTILDDIELLFLLSLNALIVRRFGQKLLPNDCIVLWSCVVKLSANQS